jgi:hypothetical protein
MAESSAAASVDYAVALAQKMHRSEYAFSASPDEQAGVSNLETRIAERIRASRDVPALWIAALACYRPLLGTPVDDERLVASADRGLAPLLAECIHEARALKARASNVKSLQPIADEVSLRVGEQYEENPYPRWHSGDWSALEPMTLTDYLTKGLPGLNTEIAFPARPKVLIAGCGTGQHAIVVAKQLPDAEILAIDLSRPSLAYASIRAEEASVRNAYAEARRHPAAGSLQPDCPPAYPGDPRPSRPDRGRSDKRRDPQHSQAGAL